MNGVKKYMPYMRFELSEVETLPHAKCEAKIMIHNLPAGLLFEDVVDFLQTIVRAANDGLTEHQGKILDAPGNRGKNSEGKISNLGTIQTFYSQDEEK